MKTADNYDIKFHFVFCTKRKRKIFLEKEISDRFKELVGEKCNELGLQIISMTTEDSYCHIHLQSTPELSPKSIMREIKRMTSGKLRQEFKILSAMDSLWTRQFLVSTSNKLKEDKIKNFIEVQPIYYGKESGGKDGRL